MTRLAGLPIRVLAVALATLAVVCANPNFWGGGGLPSA